MPRPFFVENPYRPGAGHVPPLLAGRSREQDRFKRTLRERVPNDNFLVTGLRGFGKTVLLDSMKTMAQAHGFLWVGNDLSESSSLSEERLALRILTDLAQAIADKLKNAAAAAEPADPIRSGLPQAEAASDPQAAFAALKGLFETTPGLPSDKLIAVLARASALALRAGAAGIILAYDEAQCLTDHAEHNEFPMSMLVESIGTIQKRTSLAPVLLVLCGLPQVQDALTETRTYTERMFQVLMLDRLTRDETWNAIAIPLDDLMPPLHASKDLLSKVVDLTGGYPYLIQFFGKELVEQLLENGGTLPASAFPSQDTLDRLDAGLFGARWNKTTDKQRDLLGLLAHRGPKARTEFSAADVVGLADDAAMTNAQATQTLQALCDRGLIYRTRRGQFAFTVPMSEEMIRRRLAATEEVADGWSQVATAHSVQAQSKAKRWRWFS